MRVHKGLLKTTRLGQKLSAENQAGALMRLLFVTNFERFNTAYLDRARIEHWPQGQTGLILFLLQAAANDWTSVETLMRQTAIPTPDTKERYE